MSILIAHVARQVRAVTGFRDGYVTDRWLAHTWWLHLVASNVDWRIQGFSIMSYARDE